MVGRTNITNIVQGGIFLAKAGETTSAELNDAISAGKYPVIKAAEIWGDGDSQMKIQAANGAFLPFLCKEYGETGESVTFDNYGHSTVVEGYSYTEYIFAAVTPSGQRLRQSLIVDQTHGTEHWESYSDSGAFLVQGSRKINGKPLSSDITLTPSDIGITNRLKLGNTYLTEQNVIDLLALLNNGT